MKPVLRLRILLVCLLLPAWPAEFARAADPYASAPPYMAPVAEGAELRALITVGQQIPLAGGGPGSLFRFIGVPDGLGARLRGDRLILTVNHELSQSQGGPAGPLPAGARVSELFLRRVSLVPGRGASKRRHFGRGAARTTWQPVSGRWAIDRLYEGEPAAPSPPGRRIARLCSAFLAGERVGFDRPVHLTGEEARSPSTFDGRGGLAFAVADREAWTLPRMGRAVWENVVALPFTGRKTALIGLEDSSDGQLYLYLGEKEPGSGELLAENGLHNGALHVLAARDPGRGDESVFRTKTESLEVEWRAVDYRLTDTGLSSASTAAGAFTFIRPEDGAADPKEAGVFYFTTTGAFGSANPFGRLYRLQLDPADPLAGGTLTILLDGSEGIVGPDNIDVNKHGEIAIAEDPTISFSTLRLSRDTSLWVYDTDTARLTRVAEIARGPARAHALSADPANRAGSDANGQWEVSGVIDAEDWLGRGAWILDVMAKSLVIAPAIETVQGGQVLQLVWKPLVEDDRR